MITAHGPPSYPPSSYFTDSTPNHRPKTSTSTTATTIPSYNQHYSTSPFATFYNPNAAAPVSPPKRQKIADFPVYTQADAPSTFDVPPLLFSTASPMPQAIPRPRQLAPHINVQRASEPASPTTIASTVSTHSTPSPSPSRVQIVNDDFHLYDDYPMHEQHQQQQQQQQKQMPRRTLPTYRPQTSAPAHQAHHYSEPFMGAPTWQNWSGEYYPQGGDAAAVAMSLHQKHAQRHHDDELPALSPSRATPRVSSSSRHSIEEHDTPPTPVQSYERNGPSTAIREDAYDFVDEWVDGCLHAGIDHNQNIPKLARTVSDAVQDELFNPNIAPGTTHVARGEHDLSGASKFPRIFQQAQCEHLAQTSPTLPPAFRDSSPFRANSPFHPARGPAIQPPHAASYLPVSGYNTARAMREREQEQTADAARASMYRGYGAMEQPQKTISPKDVDIEYHEPEGGMRGSLFDSNAQHDDSASEGSYHMSSHGEEEDVKSEHIYDRRGSDMAVDYLPNYQPEYSHHIGMPQYGWAGDHSSQESSDPRDDYHYDANRSPVYQRPDDTSAGGGAYSCTVHGCPLRFPTANKMSKHRREAHRHNTPMGGPMSVKAQHMGPHKCIRINPQTSKPCNTIFSRPYDLTRHEDTIHNTARQKVRCELCKDDKTFSRYDALTRHKKVKHGIDK